MRPYIDCHNHIGKTIDRLPMVGQSTAMCLARFAETNVVAAISFPTAVGSPMIRGLEDIRHHNETIARACRDFPQQFPLGLALGEPRLGPYAIEEAERAMSELGLVGIVTHPPVREMSIHFVEVAAARKGLCNLHLHDALMAQIAHMFPNATFIVHASTYAAEDLARFDNVWFEVVQYPDGRDSVWDFNWFANKVGRERLIFGTDLPYYEYRVLQQKIEAAEIDEDLKDRIAYKNILPLIAQFNPAWQMPSAPPVAPRLYAADELWAVNPEQTDRLTVYG